jgi:hypothetical protein
LAVSIVICSELIATRDEARDYYEGKLARAHTLVVRGVEVTIVFERGATHLYSTEIDDPTSIEPDDRCVRSLGGGRQEVRAFNLARAMLMDEVLRAVTFYTVAQAAGGAKGREKFLLYGPPLASAEYMLVALRPGPGAVFTCVSAYPVERARWVSAKGARSGRPVPFPPETAGDKK